MDSKQTSPQQPTSVAQSYSGDTDDRRDDETQAHEASEDNSSESLAERFARLCAEIPVTSPSSTSKPALPSLPPEHARYISRNPDGELYMTMEAVSDAEGPNRSAVISAFRAALAHAYGDEDVEGTTPVSMFSGDHSDEMEIVPETPPTYAPVDAQAEPSFCTLSGQPEFELPDIDGFTWDKSLSKQAMDHFVADWQAARKSQERLDAEEAAQAMARAAAAGARRSRVNSPVPPRKYSFNPDPVVWAAQEEAAAAAVLKQLRSNLGKLKKGSSKAPHENSVIWTLVKDSKGKLKPQAAAEMARAKVAAAAAAEAMREDSSKSLPPDSKHSSQQAAPTVLPKNHADVLYEQWQAERPSKSHKFHSNVDNGLCSSNPRFPRALSLDSSSRLKTVAKKKKVEFAADTVFGSK